MMKAQKKKKRVLILGGGFGGLNAALHFERKLKKIRNLEVTLVSRSDYSLFAPLLHEVATGKLNPRDIVVPLKKALRRVSFISGEVSAIDSNEKKVSIRQTALPGVQGKVALEISYDYLLLALGSQTNFFDLPGIEANALTMRNLTDAVILRNAVLRCLRAASIERDEKKRAGLLTFVVAGGGLAGVKTVGSINDFAREAIRRYPQLDAKLLRVVLVHAGDKLLPEFRGELSRYTRDKLVKHAVEVRLKTVVAAAASREIMLSDGERMPVGVLVWTAGFKPDALIADLPFQKEKGRILTDEFLQAANASDVWAIGDCAAIPDQENGGFYAPLAEHTGRQGAAAANNILAAMKKTGEEKRAFRFRPFGQSASIGYYDGVANVGDFRFSGFPARLIRQATYLFKLPTLENKLRVSFNWLFGACAARDLARFLSKDSMCENQKHRLRIVKSNQQNAEAGSYQAPNSAKSETVFPK